MSYSGNYLNYNKSENPKKNCMQKNESTTEIEIESPNAIINNV